MDAVLLCKYLTCALGNRQCWVQSSKLGLLVWLRPHTGLRMWWMWLQWHHLFAPWNMRYIDERLPVNASGNCLWPGLDHVRISFGEEIRNEEMNSSSSENLKLLLGLSTMNGTTNLSNCLIGLVYTLFLCLQVYENIEQQYYRMLTAFTSRLKGACSVCAGTLRSSGKQQESIDKHPPVTVKS